MIDVKEGTYCAATATYPKKITVEEARRSLNKLYEKYERQSLAKKGEMGVWRVEDKKFTIMLTGEEDCIRLLYIQFRATQEIFRHLLKSKGIDISVFNREANQPQN
jgi:predicted DNA-binding protein (MmcQ/YjbR family)